MAPASETYTKRLLTKGHGYPLWRPDLDENLPEEYITQGIRIGDLGVISNGAFRYLFNICVPAEHPINRDRTPRNFQHLDLGPEPSPSPSPPSQLGQIGTKYIEHHSHGHRKPSIISSIHNSNLQLSGNIALDAPAIPFEAGVELQLQATSSEGAALILPDGGSKSDLKPLGKFRKYALQNGVSWYQHLNGTEEWDAPNGSLYLVTGCDKSKAWAVFSFSNQVQGASVSLKLVATMVGGAGGGLSYSWQTQDSAEARCYPELPSSPENESGPMLISESANVPAPQAQNQCVFIRGFKIALRTPLYLKLFQSIELSNIVNEGFNPGHQRYIPFAGNAQLSSSAGLLGLRRSANKQGGQTRLNVTALELEPPMDETDVLLEHMTEMNDSDVLVNHFPRESQPYHPSDIINEYLLKNAPDTDIAITHDNEWIAFTKDPGFNDEFLADNQLLEWIINKYDIENQDGASFLAAKGPGANVNILSSELSSGEAHVMDADLWSTIDVPNTSRMSPAVQWPPAARGFHRSLWSTTDGMFPNAQAITVHGNTFNSVRGDFHAININRVSDFNPRSTIDMPRTSSMFSNAQDISVQGGTFNSGDLHTFNRGPELAVQSTIDVPRTSGMFSNAQGFTVQGGTFNSGDLHIENRGSGYTIDNELGKDQELGDDSDEEPSFPFEYRGKQNYITGDTSRAKSPPQRQGRNTMKVDDKLDEPDRRAIKKKMKTDK